MPEVPSVKGVNFLPTWERVKALAAENRVSRDELEARLEAEDLEILDGKPEPSFWYPLASIDRLGRILLDLEGGGCPEYYKIQGRRAAESLLARSSVKRVVEAALERGERAGQSLVGVASLVYSVGRWSFEGDLREFRIELSEAEAFPELSLWAISGCAETLFQQIGDRGFEVNFTRPDPDLVIFRGRQRNR
jgi:hypothetical protein